MGNGLMPAGIGSQSRRLEHSRVEPDFGDLVSVNLTSSRFHFASLVKRPGPDCQSEQQQTLVVREVGQEGFVCGIEDRCVGPPFCSWFNPGLQSHGSIGTFHVLGVYQELNRLSVLRKREAPRAIARLG